MPGGVIASPQGAAIRERQVEGGEPRLLDLIRMDLAHDGPAGFDYCHSKENRWIDPSPWTREGVATAGDLHHYICRGELIPNTRGKYTHPALIEAKPLSERPTLDLYEVTLLSCEKAGGKWKASLSTTEGITLQGISGLISGSIVYKPCPCISIDNRVVNGQRQSRSVTHGSPPLINRLHALQVQGIHVKTLDGLIST